MQGMLNMEQTVKNRKKEIKEIIVLNMDNNELALVIVVNALFGKYGEIFDDDGNVTNKCITKGHPQMPFRPLTKSKSAVIFL